MNRTQSISEFLKNAPSPLAKYYNPCMEVQVNVAPDNGERMKSRKSIYYQKDEEKWYNFRLPGYDGVLEYNLATHVESIGMSGWDFQNKRSIYVGFDIDSLANHKGGLADQDISEIEQKILGHKYYSLYRSTSGKGLHMYVFFDDPIETNDHHEHAALAKSLVNIISLDLEIDFPQVIDCCGMILWVWSRRQEGTNGLSLIKEGEPFPKNRIFSNWKDYVPVTQKKKTRIKYEGVEDIITKIGSTNLDPEHRRLLKALDKEAQFNWWFDIDYNMLVCHTLDLKTLHEELKLLGIFDTLSSGSSTQNCFGFPIRNGAWVFRRYSKGVTESPLWEIDNSGWTKCFYNTIATFEGACKFRKGILDSKGFWCFTDGIELLEALNDLGLTLVIPEPNSWLLTLPFSMRLEHKKSKILIRCEVTIVPKKLPDGWLLRGHFLERLIDYNETKLVSELSETDAFIRYCVLDGISLGWYVQSGKEWILLDRQDAKSVLISTYPEIKSQIDEIMGNLILNSWRIVSFPFREEYLGRKTWNKDAPQYAVEPSLGEHPTWDRVLDHLGKDLDPAIKEHAWCKENCIYTGSEYLFHWIACLLQRPEYPLPYLFFWGGQNTGKSTFHIILRECFLNGVGYTFADRALTSTFNKELYNTVIAVIEETNLSKNSEAYSKIKDYTTSKYIQIRRMHSDATMCLNTNHFVQVSNEPTACPIMLGDTRITAIHVDTLMETIPTDTFLDKIRRELPAFLYDALNLPLPLSHSRLSLPIIETEIKNQLIKVNANLFETFLDECTKKVLGHITSYQTLTMSFMSWLTTRGYQNEAKKWTRHTISFAITELGLLKGRSPVDNYTYIGNLSMDTQAFDDPDKEYVLLEGKLYLTERKKTI